MLKTVSSITNAIGALNFKGTWNAATNTPTIVSGVGVKGDYFVVSVAGSTTIDGISNWGVGDWIAYNGTVWQRVEGGADLNGVNLTVTNTTTLSGLTASTALALDASKNVVSVANTGTGDNVLATSPTLVTPILGTPQSGTLTNATGLPLSTGVTGTLPVANGGTGITSLGAGVATFLGTPSSANLAAAVTDETGTGSLVFATSPTLVTPNLGNASASSISTTTGQNNLTAGATTRRLLHLTNTARNIGDEETLVSFLGTNNFTAGFHLKGITGILLKASINGEGTFGSATNTYGSISDLKLKQDIVDAGSQWNDVKSFKFKKYRYKSDPNGHLQLGVIAQDLEESSPGLVYETRDEDIEGNDLGTVTKNVKYSILYLKAVAALQEAMERIEKLEASISELKG